MNGLLQRLAGQALGAGGPRIRSAAAVHAQVPIALTSRPQRQALDAVPAFDGAAVLATREAAPAASPDLHHSMDQTVGAINVQHTRRAERLHTEEGMTHQVDAAAPPPSMPVTVPLAPAPLLGQLAALALPPAGSIRPAVAVQSKATSDGEPTEVHVHIGRIEVTALPATAAPKQRERPARHSVPLSDYLANRRSS